MAKVLIDDNILTDIADAIRAKTNSATSFYPNEMADAIDDIPQTITTVQQNVTRFEDYYIISQDDYNNIDLSNYSVGDIFIVVPDDMPSR